MFIAVEGIDGSGKTTLCKSLADRLSSRSHVVFLTREPTSSLRITEKESASHDPKNGLRLFFRFTEDRFSHQNEIRFHLEAGEIVICDRYLSSSLAYQGAIIGSLFPGMDETVQWMQHVSDIIRIRPDFTVYLDAEPESAMKRISGRDSFSGFENTGYLEKVREYYRRVIPQDSIIIDSSLGADEVLEKALEAILSKMK